MWVLRFTGQRRILHGFQTVQDLINSFLPVKIITWKKEKKSSWHLKFEVLTVLFQILNKMNYLHHHSFLFDKKYRTKVLYTCSLKDQWIVYQIYNKRLLQGCPLKYYLLGVLRFCLVMNYTFEVEVEEL